MRASLYVIKCTVCGGLCRVWVPSVYLYKIDTFLNKSGSARVNGAFTECATNTQGVDCDGMVYIPYTHRFVVLVPASAEASVLSTFLFGYSCPILWRLCKKHIVQDFVTRQGRLLSPAIFFFPF